MASPIFEQHRQLLSKFPTGCRVALYYSNGKPTGKVGSVLKIMSPHAQVGANEVKVAFDDGTHEWVLPYFLKRIQRR